MTEQAYSRVRVGVRRKVIASTVFFVDGLVGALRKRGALGSLQFLLTDFPSVFRKYVFDPKRDLASGIEFDQRYNTSTGGKHNLHHFNISSPNQRYGRRYEASDPLTLARLLERLPIRYEDFHFIDYGCGKGRVLLVASQFPFREVSGVDFAPELCNIARNNIRAFQEAVHSSREVHVLCLDAADHILPEGPMVLYLNNPFGEEVMAKVVKKVVASLEWRPRDCCVIYANPVCASLWAAERRFHLFHSDSRYNVYTAGAISQLSMLDRVPARAA